MWLMCQLNCEMRVLQKTTLLSRLLWYCFFFFVKKTLEQDAVFWRVSGNGHHKMRRSFYYCQCPAGNLRMLDAAVSSASRSSCEPVLTIVTHKFRCLGLFPHKRNTQCQPLNQYLIWVFRIQSKIQLMLDCRSVQCIWLIASGIC